MTTEHENIYDEDRIELCMDSDSMGGLYGMHINRMTREGLHSKAMIAAELAYRDDRIAELEAQLQERPEVTREEDGWIQIEWYRQSNETFSLSISPRGEVAWAYLLPEGGDSGGEMSAWVFSSIAQFLPESPKETT